MASLPTVAGPTDSFNESIARTCPADRGEKTDCGDCNASANTNKSFAETEVLFPVSREPPATAVFLLQFALRRYQLRKNCGHQARAGVPISRRDPPVGGSVARPVSRLSRPHPVRAYSRPRVRAGNGRGAGSLGNRWVSDSRGARGRRGWGGESASADVACPRVAAALVAGRGGGCRIPHGFRVVSRIPAEGPRELTGRATDCGADWDTGGSSRSSTDGSPPERNRTNGEIASASSTLEWNARKS